MPQVTVTQDPPAPKEITTTGANGTQIKIPIPQSESDISALYARRQDIRDQIASNERVRSSLVAEIRSAPEGVSRTGLEQRITVIDQDILRLQKQLSTISQQLDVAPSELIQNTTQPSTNGAYNDGWEEGMATGMFTTAAALTAIFLFFRWRRKRRKKKGLPEVGEGAESPRMERLEQGMEAIAIEIERISEGQRFVTKLLSESRDPITARIQQPVTAADK